MIVWIEGDPSGSQSEREFFLAFLTSLNAYARDHTKLEQRVYPGLFFWPFVKQKEKNEHSFLSLSLSLYVSLPFSLFPPALCLPLLLTFILSPKLGSCWASEKGGNFLLDKHVINLREHILSHHKITKWEMSGFVT